jgi:hypothetical protein
LKDRIFAAAFLVAIYVGCLHAGDLAHKHAAQAAVLALIFASETNSIAIP